MKGKRALVLALVCAAASAEAQTWSVMPGHGEEGLLVAAWGSGRENLAFLSQGGTILKSTDGGRSFTHLKLDQAAARRHRQGFGPAGEFPDILHRSGWRPQ